MAEDNSTGVKYRRVASELREEILAGDHPVGASLPKLQVIADRFDVSFVTASRAVGVLSQEGLVSTAQKRNGIVVLRNRPAAPPRSTTLACLFRPARSRGQVDNFALDMVEGVRDAISERGYRFIHHGLDEDRYEKRTAEAVEAEGACGLLLDQKTPLDALIRLSALGVPAVLFNRDEDVPGLSTVSVDFAAVAKGSAELFRAKGYERVAFYAQPKHEATWTQSEAAARSAGVAFRREFVAAARKAGFEGDRLVLIPESDPTPAQEEPETYGLPRKRPPGWRSLAIQARSDTTAVRIVKAVGKTNLELGRDVGVVGCYDLEVGRGGPTPLTTWRVDGWLIGAAAVRELLARVERPGAPKTRLSISAEFLDRGTA